MPLDRTWEAASSIPAFVELYERSREQAPSEAVDAATIPVETFRGDLLLVAGGDDRVWPSALSAGSIAARRARFGLPTVVVEDARAGHPIVLPGEGPADLDRPYQVGGDAGAPQRLGEAAWPAIRSLLGIDSDGTWHHDEA